MRSWMRGRRGDMVEGALTLPLMALVTLALVNLALAGYASVTASNAASYAARAASVAQSDPAGVAAAVAARALQAGIGTYHVTVAVDATPGGRVAVRVRWEVPNFFGSLMPLFGQPAGQLRGEAVSTFRKEGW